MSLSPVVIRHTEAALREVLSFIGAADGTLSRYFRSNPKLGLRDRGIIAEAVYSVLRHKAVYAHFAESGGGAQMRRLSLLGLADIVGIDILGGAIDDDRDWLTRVMSINRNNLQPLLRSNLPQWLFDKLVESYGQEQTLLLAQALNQRAPLDLRANLIKSNREDVIAKLTELNIVCEPTPFSSNGVRLFDKKALHNVPLFNEGAIEVQDEGSQLLAQIVGAKRGEMIVDMCAGSGGKTLPLGAAMRNTGRLYAFDISEKRLAKLKPRLARSGLSNVHPGLIAHERDTKIKRLAGKIDRVLVDAPCSGVGTLRRNPDIKWRQMLDSIAQLNEKQIAILDSASTLVKVGGRLVYATCSLLPEENENIVQQFLARHPDFVLVPMRDVLAEQKINLEMDDFLKLLPHVHHTDGFFAAVFTRN